MRDAAIAHVRALELDNAQGRYLVNSVTMLHLEFAQLLKKLYPNRPVSTTPVCHAIAPGTSCLIASLQPDVQFPFWKLDASKSVRDLGLSYYPIEDSIKAQVASLISTGFIPADE